MKNKRKGQEEMKKTSKQKSTEKWAKRKARWNANARLIAAAPDMLATLRAIAADCEDYLNDDLEMDAGELCIAFLKAINEVHDKATGSCFVAENPVDEFGEAVTQWSNTPQLRGNHGKTHSRLESWTGESSSRRNDARKKSRRKIKISHFTLDKRR